MNRFLLVGFAAAWAAIVPLGAVEPGTAAFEDGVKQFVNEDYKQAQAAFERAVKAQPRNSNYHLWLGRAYGRRAERNSGFKMFSSYGLAKKVRKSFERAVELAPDNIVALESLFSYYLEAPGVVGGSASKAADLAKRIAKISEPQGARAWAAYYESKKDYDNAEKSLDKARALEPDNVGHSLSLASYLARRGWFGRSDEIFEEVLSKNPDSPEVWFARAKALIRGERKSTYSEARKLLERYLETPLAQPDAEPYSSARELLDEI